MNCGQRRYDPCYHPLHGRGGVLRTRRHHARRQAAGHRYAGDLRGTQIPGQVWEVFARPLQAGLSALHQMSGIHRVSLAGDHLRVITLPETGRQDIVGALAPSNNGTSRWARPRRAHVGRCIPVCRPGRAAGRSCRIKSTGLLAAAPGASGTMRAITRYATSMPGPVRKKSRTVRSRTMVGSILVYSPIPAHTPAIMQFVVLRWRRSVRAVHG